jgi:uncharacterized lipoprotein YajG
MKSILTSAAMAAVAVGFASCAQPPKTVAVAKASPAGSRFDDVGRVTMHPGQPCATQIMFDFQGADSRAAVWLAARMKDTKLLTDAARRSERVHVSGVWHRGKEKACNYVDVSKVEAASSRFF